jgi:putative addiction module component (TIGR02574 family)
MSQVVQDLYERASELTAEDRAELAGLLLESLDDQPEPGHEEAWAAEIGRRMDEYRAGRVKTIAWHELRAHLHRSDR